MLALGKGGAKNSAQIFSSELITCDVITLLTSRLWGEWGGKQMDLRQPWPQWAYSKNPEMSKYQKTYDEEISSTTSGLDVGKWWCPKRNRDQGMNPQLGEKQQNPEKPSKVRILIYLPPLRTWGSERIRDGADILELRLKSDWLRYFESCSLCFGTQVQWTMSSRALKTWTKNLRRQNSAKGIDVYSHLGRWK